MQSQYAYYVHLKPLILAFVSRENQNFLSSNNTLYTDVYIKVDDGNE